MARKNGKTALIAALVLVHLVGPEQEINGEIYSAANERDQAAIVYKYVVQMLHLEPELEALVKIVESTKTIVCYGNGTVYRAISAEAGSKHGFNPSVVIYDELGQAKNRNLYDALETAQGTREQPLFFVISTQNPDPQHILAELIDDGLAGRDHRLVVELYSVPDWTPTISLIRPCGIWPTRPWTTFGCWWTFKKHAERAKRMLLFRGEVSKSVPKPAHRCQKPIDTAGRAWMACADEDCRPTPARKGLPWAGSVRHDGLVRPGRRCRPRPATTGWRPGSGNRATCCASMRTAIMSPTTWRQMGLIDAPPGRAHQLRLRGPAPGRAERMTYDIVGVANDRWRVDLLVKELVAIEGVDVWVDGKDNEISGSLRFVPWGQGFKDMAPSIDAIGESVIEHHLKHTSNPVLTWCLSNALAITDHAGNRKLDKSKSRFQDRRGRGPGHGQGLKITRRLRGKKAQRLRRERDFDPMKCPYCKRIVCSRVGDTRKPGRRHQPGADLLHLPSDLHHDRSARPDGSSPDEQKARPQNRF